MTQYLIVATRKQKLADRIARAMTGLLGRCFAVQSTQNRWLWEVYVRGETETYELRCYRSIALALRKLAHASKTASKRTASPAKPQISAPQRVGKQPKGYIEETTPMGKEEFENLRAFVSGKKQPHKNAPKFIGNPT